MAEDRDLKVSFYEKNARTCPVCDASFHHEQMLTGGGRLMAGRLRPDLRRTYETSKKYGDVYPLIYAVVVCPRCYYAALADDFELIDKNRVVAAREERENRIAFAIKAFGYELNFENPRDLLSGAASYFLAIAGYLYHAKQPAPTFKKGVCALRGAWTLEDLAKERPGENFEDLQQFFMVKARENYVKSIDNMQSGKENFDKVKFGPDVDKNFGYDGMLYLAGLLISKTAYLIPNVEEKAQALLRAKRNASKIFGSGRSSKSKPSEILDFAKELYTDINNNLQDIADKFGIVVE